MKNKKSTIVTKVIFGVVQSFHDRGIGLAIVQDLPGCGCLALRSEEGPYHIIDCNGKPAFSGYKMSAVMLGPKPKDSVIIEVCQQDDVVWVKRWCRACDWITVKKQGEKSRWLRGLNPDKFMEALRTQVNGVVANVRKSMSPAPTAHSKPFKITLMTNRCVA